MKISFIFDGGCLDGQTISGETDMRVCDNLARRYVFLTDGGRIGKRFREFSPEQCERIREVLDTQTASMKEMDAVVHRVMSEIDPSHPPSCQELKKRMAVALHEIGADLSDYLKMNQEENANTECELENIKSAVYEVVSRVQDENGIRVYVKYCGQDTAASMYDL